MRSLVTFASSIGAVLLTACATPGQVAQHMVRANLGQEQAHNSLLLLNVVRAYHRMPMHFTHIKTVRLPLGVGNPTLTLPTPWGPDFTTQIYNFSTQLSITQSVDSEVLDGQEFMRGITTPVTTTTLLYYLDQGWPQQMILHLFVRSVDIYAPCKPKADGRPNDEGDCASDRLIDRVENYPQNPASYSRFQQVMRGLLGCEIDPNEGVSRTAFGPILQTPKLSDVAALAAAKKESLELLPVDRDGKVTKRSPFGYRLFKQAKSPRLQFNLLPSMNEDSCEQPQEVASRTRPKNMPRVPATADLSQQYAVFNMRSPEAMLYHLGEIGRAQLGEPGMSPQNQPEGFPQISYRRARAQVYGESSTLFRLRKGHDESSAVAVEYNGQLFNVPKPSSRDRSMHVLSLLTQLFGLHNKASDAPTTTNVRVVP